MLVGGHAVPSTITGLGMASLNNNDLTRAICSDLAGLLVSYCASYQREDNRCNYSNDGTYAKAHYRAAQVGCAH